VAKLNRPTPEWRFRYLASKVLDRSIDLAKFYLQMARHLFSRGAGSAAEAEHVDWEGVGRLP
jgi:hypothetical protein